MDFGLGLVLSFTDRATAGINNAVNSLNQLTQVAESASSSLNQMASLSAFSVVTNQLGDSLLNAGKGVLGMFSSLLSKTMSVGSEFESFHVTLDTLYGSTEKASEALNKLLSFSAKTPFEVGDVKDLLVVLKSNGVDAFTNMKGSVKGLEQETLAWIGDLMAFKPDIPASRWKLAFTNFLGSGAPKVLENALDMGKIADTIGHDIGNTAQERMESLVEFIEKKDLGGLMNNMMGTWSQVLSNMSDVWTMFVKKIADSGVFDSLKLALTNVTSAIAEISDSGKLDIIAKALADGLGIIINPLIAISNALGNFILKLGDLAETHPGLVKLGVQLVALAGIFLTITGVLLKVASAFSGVSLMVLAFGNSFKNIGSIIKVGSAKMLSTLIPLTATIGLLYLAWKSDFAGMRTLVSNFVSNVQGAFNTARQALSMNVGDMMVTVRGLQNTGDFWSNITVGLIKIGTFWKALCDAWNDYTLSEDLFLKCQELGILPLITAILDLKYRFSLFKEGFIQGWNEISNKVKEFVMGLLSSLDGTIFDSLLDGVTRFIQKLSENDPESWREFGRIIGELSAKFVLAFVALKTFNSIAGKVMAVVSIFSKLAGVVKGIPSLFGGLGGKIGNVLTKMFPNIYKVLEKGLQTVFKSNISGIIPNIRIWFAGVQDAIISAVTGIASALGVPVSAVVGVIVAVFASVITYAVTHWEEFKGKILTIWDTIKTEGTAIWETLKGAFSSIFDTIKNAVSIVVESFKNLMSKFEEVKNKVTQTEAFQNFISILSAIGETIVNIVVPFLNMLLSTVSTVLQGVISIVTSVFNAIVSVVSTILSSIMNIISGILDIIVGIFEGDLDKVFQGVSTIFTSILNVITSILTSAWNIIASILNTVANFFGSILSGILNVVTGAFKGILSIVSSVLSSVFSKVSSVWNKISSTISSVMSAIGGTVESKWNKIKSTITNAINSAKDAVKSAINKMKSFFNFSWSLPKLKLPHISVTGSFSLSPPSVPKFGISWYEQGGLFNKPSVIGVGENGAEAVMPLEKNTGWIGILASKIMDYASNLTPSNSTQYTTNQGDSNNQRYLTTNNNNNYTTQGNTDNSVVFNKGAIQITVQNASEEEAIRLARKIMEYIKRQKELDRMFMYA